jgi:hypothetical protein
MAKQQDQTHPQWRTDRNTLDQLLQSQPTEYHLCELARLLVRYQGFPGGRDIQKDCQAVLSRWQLSEAELYQRTRALHQQGGVYTGRGKGDDEDWA